MSQIDILDKWFDDHLSRMVEPVGSLEDLQNQAEVEAEERYFEFLKSLEDES